MTVRYLVDTSAFVRLSLRPELRAAWADELDAGRVAVCPVTELEIFYSARSLAHHQEIQSDLRKLYAWVPIPDRAFDRAAAVQLELTHLGMQRSAGPVDLIVAATAEHHRMTVLHCDKDFVSVARVTGQATRRVADSEGGDLDGQALGED